MYAHLYFDSGTAAGEIVRDITRLITSCTSSTASLSGLEFINTTNSTVAGGNSGWSLNSNSPAIPTSGTAVSTNDAYFILEATCTTNTKTKYASIQCNCDFTHSDVTLATPATTGSGAVTFNMATVLDPGTATEMFSAGYTGNNLNYTDIHGIIATADYSSGGIHIFADSTRILIHGKDGNHHTVLLGNAEFAETSTTTHQNLVPQCNFLVNEDVRGNFDETALYRGDSTGTWNVNTSTVSFFQLCEATYSYNPNYLGKIRSTGWVERSGVPEYYGGVWRGASTLSNSTTTGSTTSSTTAGLGQAPLNAGLLRYSATISLFGTNIQVEGYDTTSLYANLWGKNTALAYDSSGNVGLALRKAFWEVEPNWNNDVLDISGVSNFWRCASGLGSDGDTVTIGSDVYVYLQMAPTSTPTHGGILIKRT